MLHHYLQRGHSLALLLSLSPQERLFYLASMRLEIEAGRKEGD
jgi:hypothetical protein